MSKEINLWPWRSEHKKKIMRRFYFKLTGVSFALSSPLILWGIFLGISLLVFTAQYAQVQKDINELPLKGLRHLYKEKTLLIKQGDQIIETNNQQTLLTNVFIALAEALPQGAYLTELSFKKNNIILSGEAIDEKIVQRYITKLKQLPEIQKVLPVSLKMQNDRSVYDVTFTLRMEQ